MTSFASMGEPHIVYWAYLPSFTNPYKQGYVGVTKLQLQARVALHISSPSRTLAEPLIEYRGQIQWRILHSGLSGFEAYLIERIYRPEQDMGWNAGRGGVRPRGWQKD